MTAPDIPEPEVFELTREEYREEIARTLVDYGVTYAELQAWAADDSFPTGMARALWYAVRAVDPPVGAGHVDA